MKESSSDIFLNDPARTAFFRAPLVCEAAPQIGCGCPTKPGAAIRPKTSYDWFRSRLNGKGLHPTNGLNRSRGRRLRLGTGGSSQKDKGAIFYPEE